MVTVVPATVIMSCGMSRKLARLKSKTCVSSTVPGSLSTYMYVCIPTVITINGLINRQRLVLEFHLFVLRQLQRRLRE